MQNFPKNHSGTIHDSTEMLIRLNTSQSRTVETWRSVVAMMFRSFAHVAAPVGILSVSVLAPVANAQISPNLPNPIASPNPRTMTLSIVRSNMQDKIMRSAEAMPESKYTYRPTKDVRSFAEILNHVGDISYILCSNVKGEALPAMAAAKSSKAEITAYVKARSTTAMACTPDSPMRTSMTRRISLASRRTRCSF
jgi:hypothetical protein